MLSTAYVDACWMMTSASAELAAGSYQSEDPSFATFFYIVSSLYAASESKEMTPVWASRSTIQYSVELHFCTPAGVF